MAASSGLHTGPASWVRMKPPLAELLKASGLGAAGVAIAAAGIHVGETDDAPGAALLGILLMIGLLSLAVRIARRKSPPTPGHP